VRDILRQAFGAFSFVGENSLRLSKMLFDTPLANPGAVWRT
jgi:hypothetical protein